MAGLRLGAMAGVSASPSNGFTSSTAPSTAMEAGFGAGSTLAGRPSSVNTLTPNDPFGVALWTGIGALALLLLIRHSLPA